MDLDNLFTKQDWEYFATFRLPHPRFKKDFWRFIKQMQIEERLQVTLFYAYVSKPFHHIHCLLAGHSKMGRTLADVDWERWRRRWGNAIGYDNGAMEIERTDTSAKREKRLCYILSEKNLGNPDSDSEASIYNFRLFLRINPTMEVHNEQLG